MPEPIMTALIVGKTAEKAFENVVKDLYNSINNSLGKKYKEKIAISKIKSLYKQIEKVRTVKTLWQLDKPVDIAEFYCPSYITIRTNEDTAGMIKGKHNLKEVAKILINHVI